MSLHSDTLFWFQANQYLLLLLSAAYLAENQQIVFGSIQGEHANHYTSYAVTTGLMFDVSYNVYSVNTAAKTYFYHKGHNLTYNFITNT